MVEKIDMERGDVNRSLFLRRLLEEGYQRRTIGKSKKASAVDTPTATAIHTAAPPTTGGANG
jgi:hypothetical protein